MAHKEILLPHGAPLEFADRQTLWSAVDKAEKRSDSRTAREIRIALPNELTLREWIWLTREYAVENFVSKGLCADFAIHHGKLAGKDEPMAVERVGKVQNNPHAHILLTTREIDENGFCERKNRDWNKRENLVNWREQWAIAQNKEFEQAGLEIRVSHESYKVQGIDREPTKHISPAAMALERRGIKTEQGDRHRVILELIRERERDYDRDRDWEFEM